MTYAIGHVILGTYLPWDEEKAKLVAAAYLEIDIANDEVPRGLEGITPETLVSGDDNWQLVEFTEMDPWVTMYHGSAQYGPAYAGVELKKFDETDHFPLVDLIDAKASKVQYEKAWNLYQSLPRKVRDVLPAFGVYVVWSSS